MPAQVDLSRYRNPEGLDKGRGLFIRTLWFLVNGLFLQNPLNPSSKLKILLLRAFGARIGVGCTLKNSINVKSPWHLEIGDHSWLGEKVWIDSLAPVRIGSNVCLSQEVYLCCGNHDWSSPTFAKSVYPITIEDGAWVATRATVLPGVTVGSHSVVAAGTIISKSTEPYTVYAGNPAVPIRTRSIRDEN